MKLNKFLDCHYGEDGDQVLRNILAEGADPNAPEGPLKETALHVATRRRRKTAVEILLDHGADIDARTAGGKTAYAHAARRGFDEIAELLYEHGAETHLTKPDQLAEAMVHGQLEQARALFDKNPKIIKTGNLEEDRLLADMAGRNDPHAVAFLVEAGADLTATGLDSGTPLHQAAWFGQPANARILIEAGAPLEVFEATHGSSPLGWAVHGSRFSGDAQNRQEVYLELVKMLLEAGSRLHYPNDPQGNAYAQILLADATPPIRNLLRRWLEKR